jgi:uncharacterized protein
MPDGNEPVAIKVLESIHEVAPDQWDACAGGDDPFVGHAFLGALEDSGSIDGETGWQPQHLIIEDEAGAVRACAPLYLKNHSYGEYVFDWGWAEAYQRAGGRYYPKLQSAVPFTPITGRRLLVRPGADRRMADFLVAGMVSLAERMGVSSLHVTFPTEAEWRRLGAHGFLLRLGQQYHWENHGYASFEDFLGALSSRKRKIIRRERRAVAESGLHIATLSGDAIEERHWDAFYRFYRDTSDRKWGPTYLNREFFSLLGETMAERIALVIAEADGRPVGGALNLIGADALYGRYWGASEDHPFLHFEACYYRAIDFAIEHGLARVEAGAQGPHKIQRGYLPMPTYSAHWIADAGFAEAVERYLADERDAVTDEIQSLARLSPFRRDGG